MFCKEFCHGITPSGKKIFYDYGHYTIDGSKFFGEQIYEHDDETVKICSLEQLFQLCNSNDPEFIEFNDSIVNIDLK